MATERMTKAAKLIAAGSDVADALLEAGYGPGCIAGLAPVFPDILEAAGLGPKAASTGRAKPDATRSTGPAARTGDRPTDTTGDGGKGAGAPTAKEA